MTQDGLLDLISLARRIGGGQAGCQEDADFGLALRIVTFEFMAQRAVPAGVLVQTDVCKTR